MIALMGLQFLMLVVFGCSTVASSLRQDLTNGMMESHRLMPITPAEAIGGYLGGSVCQILSLALVNFILGVFMALSAGLSLERWCVPNLLLLAQAAMLWAFMLFMTFYTRHAFAILLGSGILSAMTNFVALMLLPALMFLYGPIFGSIAYSFSGRFVVPGEVAVISVLAQLAVGGIFYAGSMRRYRRPEQSGLGIVLALALLAAWVGLSIMGLRYWDRINMLARFWRDLTTEWQFLASMVVSMLLGLAAVASAARDASSRGRGPRTAGAASLVPPATVIGATAIIMLLLYGVTELAPLGASMVARMAIVVAAFYVSMRYLLGVLYRAGRKGMLLGGGWIALTWLGPLALAYLPRTDPLESYPMLDRIATISPVGALGHLVMAETDTTFGLAVQVVLALGLAILAYATDRPANPAPIALGENHPGGI